ncbi:MAG TPA: ATP-binding protein [Vicinamibacterales bacterium]|nr:ATP-binding protein [Vicinamibacterales bacterium]
MRIASSLTNRIFIGSTVLATLSLGLAFLVVNASVSAEAEADLRHGLTDSSRLVDLRRETLTETFTTMARLVADIPRLKATMGTAADAKTGEELVMAKSTVQRVADEYRQMISADLLLLTDPRGALLGVAGSDADAVPQAIPVSLPTEEVSTFMRHARGLLQVISVPIVVLDADPPLILGRLSIGFFMDDRLAARFKELTGSEVAFASEGGILASSLPRENWDTLARVATTTGITSVGLGDEEYLALARPISRVNAAANDTVDAPVTLVLRSRTARLSVLNSLRLGLAGALIITILLATILSYAVARTVTRPLSTVTSAMRDVAATGDLTRRVLVRSGAWDDEDARLLASAFNTLTESIGRFQREAAQKERLSSLGRLSTVIAHEIRNPLMIIRATLASLRGDHVSAADRREAAADIDEETTRLNRLVTDVLDFAKPIRLERAPANLNEVCRASTSAAWAGQPDADVQLQLDPQMPAAMLDAERLRTALVNILTNARHAVQAAATPAGAGDGAGGATGSARVGVAVASRPGVIVSTRHQGTRATVTVNDHGAGIAPEDMAHIFDPYFTTRRKGTGLGLPIAKNIIEGLGGTITVTSRPGEGTQIRIDLPLTPPEGTS